MGVVELADVLVGEGAEVLALGAHPAAHDVLQAGAGEEVLLAQAQLLAVLALVVGVEHARDVFGLRALLDRGAVIAGVELAEVEFLDRGGVPQAQGVDGAVAVAGHRHVVGDGLDVAVADPAHAGLAARVVVELGLPAELHPLGVLGAVQLPRAAVGEPGVRRLDLVAVDDLLAEHAVVVADAVAEHRQRERGARIEEAGGEAAETAIAEAGIRLLGGDLLHLQAEVMQSRCDLAGQAEVEQGVA